MSMLFRDMLERDMVTIKDTASVVQDSVKILDKSMSFILQINFSCPISSHETVELFCLTNIGNTKIYYSIVDSAHNESKALSEAFSDFMAKPYGCSNNQVRFCIEALAQAKVKRNMQILMDSFINHVKQIDNL